MAVLPVDLERPSRPVRVDLGWLRSVSGATGCVVTRDHRTPRARIRFLLARCRTIRPLRGCPVLRAILRRVSLVIDDLHKHFGPTVALDGLSFDVPAGQVFGFLGANGAGKTTTMRIVLGVLGADRGTVTWKGTDSRVLPRSTWGYLPEERGLYPRMVVVDQLAYFAVAVRRPAGRARREALHWLARFRVPELATRRAEELSKGNQQKIQLIAAVLHDPVVLLMDEPFTGLDPVNVALLREAFLELRDQGRTLIFSTHQMETVEALCESIAIVDRGKVVVGGPVRDIRREAGRRLVLLAVEGDHRLCGSTRFRALGSCGRASTGRRSSSSPGSSRTSFWRRRSRAAPSDPLRSRRHSLEQIFIDHVGRPPDEDLHLAPDSEVTDTEPATAEEPATQADSSEPAA